VKAKYRAGPALRVAGRCLIPVEWVSITAQHEGGHLWLQAEKAVAAVVFCEADTTSMLDVSGESMSLEEWLPKVDGLAAALQACRA